MNKLGGANVGTVSRVNGGCHVVRISYRRGGAVADCGVQHTCFWQWRDGSWGHHWFKRSPHPWSYDNRGYGQVDNGA
jgi:hypothetical protein